jgi:glyoxylase-like metal-dependent hydrolase (beta-lactamase superfamily II)
MSRVGKLGAAAVAAAVAVVGGAVVYLYSGMNAFRVVEVGPDVHVIEVERLGGNVGVLATEQGAVVVDTMTFRFQGEQILEMAERVGRGPVQAVINTHYHQDHTHGNPAFPVGTKVVATRRTRDYLRHFDGDSWQGAAGALLPNDTFEDTSELRVGGKTVRSRHLGRGHTGGDLVVQFVEDRVIHAGDLFFHGRYPNIDLEAGGSLREWIATLDRVLELDFDRVIPGHGPVADREALAGFQRFLRELWAVGEDAARRRLSLEETLAGAALGEDRGYRVISFPLVFRLDRDFAIRRAWEEATGAVRPVEVPAS